MKTATVRDVRQRRRGPAGALRTAGEAMVTRDSRSVTTTVPFEAREAKRRAIVDWDALSRWRDRFWRSQPAQSSTDADLAADRADRR